MWVAALPWRQARQGPELKAGRLRGPAPKKAVRLGVRFVALQGARDAISDPLKRITLNPRI